ncbi:MAG: hypothetical protein KF861_00340 [Planctomycetaceae bacterium]|nr:hypothetical protein [Planctomycetaceae bacterium]
MSYTRGMNNLAHIHTAMQNDANTIVAANIRAELGLAGLAQTDLASALGQNDMWLSRRMKGSPDFSVVEVQAVADYFAVEPGDLFKKRTRPTRPVGPTGIEPMTSTVEDERLATVTSIASKMVS